MQWDSFEARRSRLFGIAYRMLGSVMEAEDIVQEAYLRVRDSDPDAIANPDAYLRKVVIRLSLDHLKAARATRELYVGPWLPEPLIDQVEPSQVIADEPGEMTIQRESLSMAFMLLLENLTPDERAVFLLHEVFDYDYGEIAGILGKSESACRQVLSRARKYIQTNRPRFRSTPQEHNRIFSTFLSALHEGNMNGLMSVLSEGVRATSDGGGKVSAATRILTGRETVAKFIFGLRRLAGDAYTYELIEANGQPGLLSRDPAGQAVSLMLMAVSAGQVQDVYFVRNPDKLARFQPPSG